MSTVVRWATRGRPDGRDGSRPGNATSSLGDSHRGAVGALRGQAARELRLEERRGVRGPNRDAPQRVDVVARAVATDRSRRHRAEPVPHLGHELGYRHPPGPGKVLGPEAEVLLDG